MEPLAGMLFGVVGKPAHVGTAFPRRDPGRKVSPGPARREVSLLRLYQQRHVF